MKIYLLTKNERLVKKVLMASTYLQTCLRAFQSCARRLLAYPQHVKDTRTNLYKDKSLERWS